MREAANPLRQGWPGGTNHLPALPARRADPPIPRVPKGTFPIGAWNIAPEAAMFQMPHFVAGPAPSPWNPPFPKLIHQTGPGTPENPRFQLRTRPPAPCRYKSKSLYTCMTSKRSRSPRNLIGWFIREPPYKGLVPEQPPVRLEGVSRFRRAIDAGNQGRDKMQNNNDRGRRMASGRLVGNPTATLQGYTAKQRETLRLGLRVLARIIARAHLRRQGRRSIPIAADEAGKQANPGSGGDQGG